MEKGARHAHHEMHWILVKKIRKIVKEHMKHEICDFGSLKSPKADSDSEK